MPSPREWLPTPIFWPGEYHGLVPGVTKSQTQLNDFHFEEGRDMWVIIGEVWRGVGPLSADEVFASDLDDDYTF